MDTELFKMLLTVINQIIDKLPVWLSGIITLAICIYGLHRWKRMPYKIMRVGVNGSATVTASMLRANCDAFHLPLNNVIETQTKSLDMLVFNQAKIQERVGEIAETVSFIRGQLSK